jgi:hypothetical protein
MEEVMILSTIPMAEVEAGFAGIDRNQRKTCQGCHREGAQVREIDLHLFVPQRTVTVRGGIVLLLCDPCKKALDVSVVFDEGPQQTR